MVQTATTWSQTYDPLGNLWLSGLVAAIPILFFFAALTVLKLKGHVAGTITLLLAMAVAVTVFGMPAGMALAAAIYGFCYGLWPIAWIIDAFGYSIAQGTLFWAGMAVGAAIIVSKVDGAFEAN